MVKTKRYTHSRLRRILCHLLLGSTKQDLASAPAYARVLGSNARGLEVLKACKQTAVIPVSADFTQLAKQAPRQALLDCRATDLFALTTNPRQPAGMDFTEQPVMLLED